MSDEANQETSSDDEKSIHYRDTILSGSANAGSRSNWNEDALDENLKTLPGLEIQEKIGEGGMGSVYRARQLSLNRTVAIKVLPKHLCEDRTYASRLYREGEVLGKINHPNVTSCYDLGEHQGVLYVVMEYVEGTTLGRMIDERGKLPLDESIHYLKEAVLGLDHAHAMGIVHRDIKPDNMLLDKQIPGSSTTTTPSGYSLKIADLGLAAYTSEGSDTTKLTMDGSTLGTPHFMSPEQALGESNIDFHTDIYALGITLYNMLTGEMPFESSNPGVILAKKLSTVFPDVRTKNEALPAEVSLLLQRMTARKAEDRYESYGALLEDFKAIEKGIPLDTNILSEEKSSMALSQDTLRLLKKSGRAQGPVVAGTKGAVQSNASAPALASIAKFVLMFVLGIAGVGLIWFIGRPNASDTHSSESSASTDDSLDPKDGTPDASDAKTPKIKPYPVFESYSLFDLNIDGMPHGWRALTEKTRFAYHPEARALAFGLALKHFQLAEYELPHTHLEIKAKVTIPMAADRCELQWIAGGEQYLALGVRFPPGKEIIGYMQWVDLKTHAPVLDGLKEIPGLDPNNTHELTLRITPREIQCAINGKPLARLSLPVQVKSFTPGRLRLGVKNGSALFEHPLRVSPLVRVAQ